MPIDTILRQWCRECQDVTVSVLCDCGYPCLACQRCGGHPDRLTGGKTWIHHDDDDDDDEKD